MRATLFLIPALLWAQTPAPRPAVAPVKPAAAQPAKSAVTPAVVKPALAPGAAKPAVAPGGAKPAVVVRKPAVAPKAAVKPMTDDEKAVYALGLNIYRSLGQFDLTPAELEICKQAMADAAAKTPAGDLEAWGPLIDPLARSRAAKVAERQKAASVAFLAKAAVEMGAQKSESGLIYREMRAGTGVSPTAADTVKVNYRGTLTDGTEFDSSYKRNEPAQFPLTGVIKCWTEGVQKMKPGGKALLVCPSDLAYGDQGRPSIPGGATLVFEIELLEVVGAAPAAK